MPESSLVSEEGSGGRGVGEVGRDAFPSPLLVLVDAHNPAPPSLSGRQRDRRSRRHGGTAFPGPEVSALRVPLMCIHQWM